ncbi:MAG: hypothetical protein ORN98_10485 [Alphaproteobacteria bacterium]|nr:hypothetical protein [Alphaproteobacteria bacterium]
MSNILSLIEFETYLTRYGLDIDAWPSASKLAARELLSHNRQAQKIWQGERAVRQFIPTLPPLMMIENSMESQTQSLALADEITRTHPRPIANSGYLARLYRVQILYFMRFCRRTRPIVSQIIPSVQTRLLKLSGFWQDLTIGRNFNRFWPQHRWSHAVMGGTAVASFVLVLAGSIFREDQNNLSPFDLSMSYLFSDYETAYYESTDSVSLPEETQSDRMPVSLISFD